MKPSNLLKFIIMLFPDHIYLYIVGESFIKYCLNAVIKRMKHNEFYFEFSAIPDFLLQLKHKYSTKCNQYYQQWFYNKYYV